ncbi:hypothetical protein [Staphylococcus gallinarum]|uniref:hypothetical protein n=1 Tax=Staphylococcus gallinarum TaxID=1293 RepID=UPI0030C31BC2
MNLKKFQAHIEGRLPALDSFYDRAINYQLDKDKRRPPKKNDGQKLKSKELLIICIKI